MSLFEIDNNNTALCELKRTIVEKRIPINANIYITNKCNFKCLHCYVQSQKNNDNNALNIEQWKRILDILKNKGCLSITFSGGEVLSSNKFVEIYNYAYSLNFKISIITNNSLLNEEYLKVLSDKKPECIIATIYGSTNETYKFFCGINKGWDIVSRNILLLKSKKINVKLQTVLNTVNYNDLEDMKQFAESNNMPFTVFRNINCEIDGNARPLQYQISLQQEIKSFKFLDDGKQFLHVAQKNDNIWINGYKHCFAGLTNCYIDCCGNLFLCNHSSSEKYSILDHGFDVAWENMLRLRKIEIEVGNECAYCKYKGLCGKCTPTFNKLKRSIGYPFPDCKKIKFLKEELSREVV